MAFVDSGNGALDYSPCRYGGSRLMFRGPSRALDRDYIAAFGGSETYGRFVPDPWPGRLEASLDLPVINFGCLNAGADTFVQEDVLARLGRMAKVSVVQMVGAANLSNSFYYVHPRRNDRFLTETGRMRDLFPKVDFSEFTSTWHMLGLLRARDREAFRVLEAELKAVWMRQMTRFVKRLGGRVLLLWIDMPRDDALGYEPVLVTPEMIAEVARHAAGLVRVTPSAEVRAQGTEGMQFAPMEAPAAAAMPGPGVHAEIAAALLPAMRKILA
ncbi:DUF6473 family protein [Paenirhodobacter sp.]|uniref:DUF6473 family protein n=1 Tax=Paenirhodobacter sp. TaxID=1965326 RepID=UPI003B3C9815